MSKSTEDSPARVTLRLLRPRWFLTGMVLGLMLMAWLGRRAVSSDFHPQFARFIPPISPEASYYPTVNEMCAIVRARCRSDQVLVIVGGNSVLLGVWQPVDVVWTRKLQERLGDHYCVINLAMRGASPTNSGAVVAEVLRKEFPRQIYIANEKPASELSMLGITVYRYAFWQAYFAGQLLADPDRERQVRDELLDPAHHAMVLDLVTVEYLDRILRFRDFWNRQAFERLNTVASLYAPAPPAMFRPRRIFEDTEPDATNLTLEQRYLPAVRETEMKIVRATTELTYRRARNGGWEMQGGARFMIKDSYRQAFPKALRSRTLLLIGRESPFFRHQLTPGEFARNEQAIHDAVAMLHAEGYAALEYGGDYTDEDYGDRTHLAPSGGEKLAAEVAHEVTALAGRLDYLK
jgi:hypothetical protein